MWCTFSCENFPVMIMKRSHSVCSISLLIFHVASKENFFIPSSLHNFLALYGTEYQRSMKTVRFFIILFLKFNIYLVCWVNYQSAILKYVRIVFGNKRHNDQKQTSAIYYFKYLGKLHDSILIRINQS